MTSPVDVVRGAVAALNAGDIDRYLAGFAPSCQRWVAGIDVPFDVAAIGENLRLLHAAFDDLVLIEDALFGDATLACARWRLQGKHVGGYFGIPAAVHTIDVETCEVYEVGRDGLVTATWTYGDHDQLFRQIREVSA